MGITGHRRKRKPASPRVVRIEEVRGDDRRILREDAEEVGKARGREVLLP